MSKLTKKFATASITVATVVSLAGMSIAPVGAVTIAELQAQIAVLTAQLAAMSGNTSTTTCYVWNGSLTIGSTGPDVTTLQNYLTGTGHFTFSGGATGYFGPITQAAVAAWQAANGVAPAVGYWGPISQARYTVLCGTTPDDDDEDTGDFFGGDDEGALENFDQIGSISNEEVGESEEDVEVLGVEFEADGADQLIQRVTVVIDNPQTGVSDDLEDYITEASLWLDGEELDRMDVEDASYDRDADEYTFRFTSLEGEVADGDTAELTVAVTGVSNLDSDDENGTWDVTIDDDAIRAASPNGSDDTYDAAGPFTETFELVVFADANNVELHFSRGDDNPDEQTVVGQSDDQFDADLLAFDMEAEGSDMDVFGLRITLTASTGAEEDLVGSLTLACDGDEWEENVTTAIVDFTDLEMTIDEGDTANCTVTGTMNEIDGTLFEEAANVTADVTVGSTDAEDESGEAVTDLTGSANGNEQTFVSEGISISNIEVDTELAFTADEASETSQGRFTIEFDVTANETEVWLDKSIEDGGDDGDNGEGIVYTVATSGADTYTLDSETFQCVSNCGNTADNTTDEFYIDEGDTETYRVTVVITGEPGNPGDFKVWIDSINWDDADVANALNFYTSNLGEESDADTGFLFLNAL